MTHPFLNDRDTESEALGDKPKFFTGGFAPRAGREVAWVLGVVALLLFFFCPRFFIWRAWSRVPELAYTVETGRAGVSLWQRDHLFEEIADPIHRVLLWRPLLPALGGALPLGTVPFLALYTAGGLAAVAGLYALFRRRGTEPPWAAAATALLAAQAWYLVATGWLAYPDGWVALALLAVAFLPHRGAVAAVCLLMPWVEERFLFGLPLACWWRWREAGLGPADWRRAAGELAGPAAAVAASLGARWLLATGLGLPFLGAYRELLQTWMVPPSVLATGLWYGWRGAWVLPVILLWREWRQGRRAGALLLLSGLAGTLALTLMTANDLSRAGVVILPVVVAGALALLSTPHGRWWVLGLLALNLLLPARHVITDLQVPVFYLHIEWYNFRQPPTELSPQTFYNRALEAEARGDRPAAVQGLSYALGLDPDFPPGLLLRGQWEVAAGRWEEAIATYRRALRRLPFDYATRHLLGEILRQSGHYAEARREYQEALRLAPPDWPPRRNLERLLELPIWF